MLPFLHLPFAVHEFDEILPFNMAAANVSTTQSTMVQPLVDSLIPGFSLVSSLFSQYFHVDLSSYISGLLVLAAIGAGLRYCGTILWEAAMEYFVCTAEIRIDDEVYNYVMAWVTTQSFSQKTCQFVAGTKTTSDRTDEDYYDSDNGRDRDDDDVELPEGPLDDWLSVQQKGKIKPLRYTPSDGTHYFRYKNHYLWFKRQKEDQQSVYFFSRSEQLFISCLGRNPAIIKKLLEEAQKQYLKQDSGKTIIYRGTRSAGQSDPQWVRCMSRPHRPLSTVVLDEAQKNNFIDDIKDYLSPSTRRWYSNRGIPYRRGYLFHGPPGTGKTSLCYSVAGLFGLKIYVVSLNSASLTEDGLAGLFQALPRRCIVLLEDIDTAGMVAKRDEDKTPTEDLASKADADKTPQGTTANKGISLSALLNIIDGVASAEGRLLVMTTNHIERLDKALRRPGRVDVTIGFGFADTPTIRGLFRAIYIRLEGDLPAFTTSTNPTVSASIASSSAKILAPGKENGHITLADGSASLSTPPITPYNSTPSTPSPPTYAHQAHNFTEGEIDRLAMIFGHSVPADEFTPAEIQGYLLKHKYSPAEAVAGAEEWVCVVRKERKLAEGKVEKKEGTAEVGNSLKKETVDGKEENGQACTDETEKVEESAENN